VATLLDKLMALPAEVTPDEAVKALAAPKYWVRTEGVLPEFLVGRTVIIECLDSRDHTTDYYLDPGEGTTVDIDEAAHWPAEQAFRWTTDDSAYTYTLYLVED
jgi:hypothetical protein